MLDLRLAVTDQPVADYPEKVPCPLHKQRTGKADKTASLAVYADHLHCYGGECKLHAMGAYGLAILLKLDHVEDARAVADKYDSASLDAYRERAATEARRDPLPRMLATLYHEVLCAERKHRLAWLHARGLSDATIAAFRLGHDGVRFTIPIFSADDTLVSVRYRRDDEYCDEATPKYQGVKGRNGLYLYPEDRLARDTRDYLVICEGELDAARLWQENIPAVSATNGAGQAHKLPKLIREQFPRVRHLLVATDQDEPGCAAADQTIQAAIAAGFDPLALTRVTWPQGKDVTEAMNLGYDFREALAVAFGG